MVGPSALMPSALRAQARWERLGGSGDIPCMIVQPGEGRNAPAPVVLWMHGRTASKELDPGRYLRWMRAGIGACAIDLPGHGERHDPTLQQPEETLPVVRQMVREIDEVVASLAQRGWFDMERLGIGGMSAGGMAALARLCAPHPFRCASVEASTGSWQHQRHRAMFRNLTAPEIDELNPIKRLSWWREIPFQAIHARHDEWVALEGQQEFVEALRARSDHPERVQLVVYDQTGAPHEHIGFGHMSADAKDRQRDFFRTWLLE